MVHLPQKPHHRHNLLRHSPRRHQQPPPNPIRRLALPRLERPQVALGIVPAHPQPLGHRLIALVVRMPLELLNVGIHDVRVWRLPAVFWQQVCIAVLALIQPQILDLRRIQVLLQLADALPGRLLKDKPLLLPNTGDVDFHRCSSKGKV